MMKLNGRLMMAAVMMIGALAATGCKRTADAVSEAIAPEDNPATAPEVDDDGTPSSGTPGFENNARRVRFYGPSAPPAARYERPSRAPSDRHFWVGGYWRWDGRQHSWVNGRWEPRRERSSYVPGRWVNYRGRWEYVPGHWVRRR